MKKKIALITSVMAMTAMIANPAFAKSETSEVSHKNEYDKHGYLINTKSKKIKDVSSNDFGKGKGHEDGHSKGKGHDEHGEGHGYGHEYKPKKHGHHHASEC